MGDRESFGAGESCCSSQARLIFSICPPQIMMNAPRPTCASTGCVSTRTAASNASASLALCWLPTGGTVSVRRSPSSLSALFPACQPCSWGVVMCLRPRGAEKTKAVARCLLLSLQKLPLRAERALLLFLKRLRGAVKLGSSSHPRSFPSLYSTFHYGLCATSRSQDGHVVKAAWGGGEEENRAFL